MELKAINPKAPEAAGPSSFALYLDSLLSWKEIIKKQKRKKPGNREGRGWADRRREGKPLGSLQERHSANEEKNHRKDIKRVLSFF